MYGTSNGVVCSPWRVSHTSWLYTDVMCMSLVSHTSWLYTDVMCMSLVSHTSKLVVHRCGVHVTGVTHKQAGCTQM